MNELPPDPPPIISEPPFGGAAGEPAPLPTAKPWGFWATTGWMLLIGLGYVLAQVAVVICWVVVNGPASLEQLESNGLLFAVATIAGAPAGVGLCVLFARLRKGIRVQDYLGLHWPGWRTVARWSAVVVGFVIASDLLTTLVLKRPLVPDVMTDIYHSTHWLPVMWIALVIAAPLVEEVMFRGFLFAGLEGRGQSRWRDRFAILATSGIWAVIHLQYDVYGIATIFVFGIVLGWARLRTGSVLLCILLHALLNLIVTVEVEVLSANE